MALLSCEDLSVGYDGKAVLEHLHFSVESGSYLAVIGENGAGKSTLMRTLLGLQPPVAGRIVRGEGLRRNEIGYLPQQTVVQRDFPASVREIVLSGCQGRCGGRPFYSKGEKQLAQMAMERMQVAALAGINLGQYQRLEYGEREFSSCSMKVGISICYVLNLDPFLLVLQKTGW